MAKAVFQTTIVNPQGVAVAFAQVTVRKSSDNSLATLYSDRDGSDPNATGITKTNSQGFVRVYLDEGRYNIEATYSGATRTWVDEVRLADPGGSGDTTELEALINSASGRTIPNPLTAGIIADPTTDLTFALRRKLRPIEVLPERLLVFSDGFENDSDFYSFSGAATQSISGGQYSITMSGAQSRRAILPDAPEAPFVAVVMRVAAIGNGSGYNVFHCGLWKDSNNSLEAAWDATNNEVRIERQLGGTTDFLGTLTSTPAPSVPFDFAFVLTCNFAQVWVDTGTGWRYVTGADLSTIDMRDPSILSTYTPSFGASSGGSTSAWRIEQFRWGYYGQIGWRDFNVVTHKDGTPYLREGFMYFTATATAVAGDGHLGIYRMNVTTGQAEKTGVLFVRRGTPLIYNDLPAHLVWDTDALAWRVFISTWGNGFSGVLEVQHQLIKHELLHAVTVLDNTTVLALTGDVSSNGVYDVSAIYFGGSWKVAYTITPDTSFPSDPMYAAMDSSADLVTFSSVFADSGNDGYEGTKLQVIGGDLYVLAGSKTDTRVYDATGTHIGGLDFTHPSPSGDAPPHPMVFPLPRNGKTEWWMMTFDDTRYGSNAFTWGTMLLYKAAETETGFEFPSFGVS